MKQAKDCPIDKKLQGALHYTIHAQTTYFYVHTLSQTDFAVSIE